MSFEDELAARMAASVEAISPHGDLADVEARSHRAHRRRQVLMTSSVAALVVVAVAAMAVLGTRDGSGEPSGVPVVNGPDGTLPVVPGPDLTDTTAPTTVADSVAPGTDAATGDTVAPTSAVAGRTDRADPYLADTEEIYRRTLPDGDVFVARLSEQSYGSMFDVDWQAPTGSADECLGERVIFVGVPGAIGWWGSAWVARGWHDDVDLSTPLTVASMGSSVDAMSDNGSDDAVYELVRTAPDVRQLVVVNPDGTETDRVDVVDGLAMIRRAGSWGDEGPQRLIVVTADGAMSAPADFRHVVDIEPTAPCSPGEEPMRPLPAAGEQPADPVAAEASVRQRHAELVDRSIPLEGRSDDLLDDDTGVDAAVDEAMNGDRSNSFATMTYEIEDVVFTDPTTAWFRYTVTILTNPVPERFGIAIFDGTVWRITRDTICGDLLLGGVDCDPPATYIQPAEDPAWVAEHERWAANADLYRVGECSPLSQCS